jgi:hypothetical protein
MSLSKALPGDAHNNPLILDENGHLVEAGDAHEYPIIVDENGCVVQPGMLGVERAENPSNAFKVVARKLVRSRLL